VIMQSAFGETAR